MMSSIIKKAFSLLPSKQQAATSAAAVMDVSKYLTAWLLEYAAIVVALIALYQTAALILSNESEAAIVPVIVALLLVILCILINYFTNPQPQPQKKTG